MKKFIFFLAVLVLSVGAYAFRSELTHTDGTTYTLAYDVTFNPDEHCLQIHFCRYDRPLVDNYLNRLGFWTTRHFAELYIEPYNVETLRIADLKDIIMQRWKHEYSHDEIMKNCGL